MIGKPVNLTNGAFKTVTSLVLALLILGVLTSSALADSPWGNGNGHGPPWWARAHDRRVRGSAFDLTLATGQAPAGQAESNVSVVPPGGSSQAAIVCSSVPTGWASPIGGSQWMSLQANCWTGLGNATTYQYSTTFNLPSNRTGVGITGSVLADDSVTILLNGTTIFTGGGLSAASSFSSNDSALFNDGANTLTFEVYNVTGPSGLDYVARVHADAGATQGRRGDDAGDEG